LGGGAWGGIAGSTVMARSIGMGVTGKRCGIGAIRGSTLNNSSSQQDLGVYLHKNNAREMDRIWEWPAGLRVGKRA
jgi:hypothetical protein